MLSFLAKHPTRTRTAHLQTLRLDKGNSLAWFKKQAKWTAGLPNSSIIAVNRLPPASEKHDEEPQGSKESQMGEESFLPLPPRLQYPGQSNSSLGPPLHYHQFQDETFLVTAGHAVFYTFDFDGRTWLRSRTAPAPHYCRAEIVKSGELVQIPRGTVHTFRNASSRHDLELEFILNPGLTYSRTAGVGTGSSGASDMQVEEAFFRNTWSYRDDCVRASAARSLLQVMCFNRRGGVVLMLPGCGIWMSWLLGTVGAFIGRFIWGYRDVYDEYSPTETTAKDPA